MRLLLIRDHVRAYISVILFDKRSFLMSCFPVELGPVLSMSDHIQTKKTDLYNTHRGAPSGQGLRALSAFPIISHYNNLKCHLIFFLRRVTRNKLYAKIK